MDYEQAHHNGSRSNSLTPTENTREVLLRWKTKHLKMKLISEELYFQDPSKSRQSKCSKIQITAQAITLRTVLYP